MIRATSPARICRPASQSLATKLRGIVLRVPVDDRRPLVTIPAGGPVLKLRLIRRRVRRNVFAVPAMLFADAGG